MGEKFIFLPKHPSALSHSGMIECACKSCTCIMHRTDAHLWARARLHSWYSIESLLARPVSYVPTTSPTCAI